MVFFFKQKTAYEMLRSLVGSEMCIRDRFKQARCQAGLDALASAWFWSSALGKPVPLAQLVERYETTSEEARLRRRDRSLCITVKCNTTGETAASAFKRLAPQLEAAMADLPEGYRMEWGGEHESSANANAGLASKIPPVLLLMMLIVVSLLN